MSGRTGKQRRRSLWRGIRHGKAGEKQRKDRASKINGCLRNNNAHTQREDKEGGREKDKRGIWREGKSKSGVRSYMQ